MTSKVNDNYITLPNSAKTTVTSTYAICIPKDSGVITDDEFVKFLEFLNDATYYKANIKYSVYSNCDFWCIKDDILQVKPDIKAIYFSKTFVIGNYTFICDTSLRNGCIYVLDNRKKKTETKEVTELKEQIKLLNEKLSKLEKQ